MAFDYVLWGSKKRHDIKIDDHENVAKFEFYDILKLIIDRLIALFFLLRSLKHSLDVLNFLMEK